MDWICPSCHGCLKTLSDSRRYCSKENFHFDRIDGVWRCLTPERQAYYARFIREYETIRSAEGRGSSRSDFYRQLPFEDLSGKFQEDWHIRALSFRTLLEKVLPHLGEGLSQKVLDLGAGNGWLSNRLAARGHQVAAVDISTSEEDGLRAHRHYTEVFTPVQADFDRLPFEDDQFDLAVFNAAFHYSVNYEKTLKEACRILRGKGRVVIMDSPLYADGESGRQMVRDREACFVENYGFPSNALASEGFLTYRRLEELADSTGLNWQHHRPFYGWQWALRPWKARLLGQREPARFAVLVGEKSQR